MDEAIDGFLTHLASRRSANTARAYAADLAPLRGGALPLTTERLRLLLRAAAPHPATRARKLSTLRAFARYLVAQGVQKDDPTERLEPPLRRRPLPKGVSAPEAADLLATPALPRDRALLELLYGAGLRVSEAAGLDLPDLDLESRTARVTGKGAKERMVVFGVPCVLAIRAYLAERVPPQAGSPLFTNARGGRLTVRSMHTIVARAAQAAGLPPLSPTASATPSPPTFSTAAPTSNPSSSFSATKTSPPPRSTPTSASNASARQSRPPTRGRRSPPERHPRDRL